MFCEAGYVSNGARSRFWCSSSAFHEYSNHRSSHLAVRSCVHRRLRCCLRATHTESHVWRILLGGKQARKATSSGIDVCTRISKRALMCLCACIGYPGRPFSRSCRKPGPDTSRMHALGVRKYQACGRPNRTCSILHLACDVQGIAACSYIRTFPES